MTTKIYYSDFVIIVNLLLKIYPKDKIQNIGYKQLTDIVSTGYSSNTDYLNQLKNFVPIVRYLHKLFSLAYKYDINVALPDVMHNYKLTGNVQIDKAYLKKIKHKQMMALIKLTMLNTMLDQ